MGAVGLADKLSCEFRVTQGDLSEATGLSVVHVNRMIQALRKRKLISFVHGQLTIHDWDELSSLGGFRVDYLHLSRPTRLPRPA
jgi:transcription initiation factor IIE alpha subunit